MKRLVVFVEIGTLRRILCSFVGRHISACILAGWRHRSLWRIFHTLCIHLHIFLALHLYTATRPRDFFDIHGEKLNTDNWAIGPLYSRCHFEKNKRGQCWGRPERAMKGERMTSDGEGSWRSLCCFLRTMMTLKYLSSLQNIEMDPELRTSEPSGEHHRWRPNRKEKKGRGRRKWFGTLIKARLSTR
jgi:hypothetical protein